MWGQVPWSIPTVLPCPFLKAIFAEILLFLPLPPILSSHRDQIFPLFQSALLHVPLCGSCNGSPVALPLETLNWLITLTKQDSLELRGAQREGPPRPCTFGNLQPQWAEGSYVYSSMFLHSPSRTWSPQHLKHGGEPPANHRWVYL